MVMKMSTNDKSFDRETEFRNAFYFIKRWVKQPFTITHGRNYSQLDKTFAKNVYEFIESIQNVRESSFEEKLNKLESFVEKENSHEIRESLKRESFSSPYLRIILSYIKRSKEDIENERPVQKRRR